MTKFIPNPNYFGGTEYMVDNFNNNIYPLLKNISDCTLVSMPGIFPNVFELLEGKVIFWIHNTPSQFTFDVVNTITNPHIKEKTICYVVPSNFAKSTWINHGIDPNKIVVIPNAVGIDKPLMQTKSKQKTIKLIYTSEPSRGLALLLKATDFFDFDFELDVFGHFTPDQKNFVGNSQKTKWVKELKNIDKFNFYGRSPKETVWKHIEKSDFFVYPSFWLETFCLAATEALALGTPVITNVHGALEEVLGKYPTYITFEDKFSHFINTKDGVNYEIFEKHFPTLFQKNIEIIAETINLAVRNKPSNKILLEQSKTIQEKYSWAEITKQWLELDKKIATL